MEGVVVTEMPDVEPELEFALSLSSVCLKAVDALGIFKSQLKNPNPK